MESLLRPVRTGRARHYAVPVLRCFGCSHRLLNRPPPECVLVAPAPATEWKVRCTWSPSWVMKSVGEVTVHPSRVHTKRSW
eukprot:5985312-Amphidinium_carterae.1